jgi:Predicted membrane protein
MLTFGLAVAVGAYLIGSIPSGFLIGRIKGVDLREVGSGNIGATNALRVLGKKWGYMVFAADFS